MPEIVSLIARFSPLLGSALQSPIASDIISLLEDLFGVSSANLCAAIKADPEAALKLKKLELAHEEVLVNYANANFATVVDDRKSARAREMSLHDYVPTVLAVGFLINYAAIQAWCVTHPASDVISARFQDVLILIMSYYFGSSHKSGVA